jgi:hypothetical protein
VLAKQIKKPVYIYIVLSFIIDTGKARISNSIKYDTIRQIIINQEIDVKDFTGKFTVFLQIVFISKMWQTHGHSLCDGAEVVLGTALRF